MYWSGFCDMKGFSNGKLVACFKVVTCSTGGGISFIQSSTTEGGVFEIYSICN